MALKIENVITGLLLFSILASLFFSAYTNISDEYRITPDYVNSEGKSVIEALNDINFISGFDKVQEIIEKFYDQDSATASEFDILGSLKAGAIGVVKIGTGLLTAPIEIIGVITGFYTLPSIVSIGLGIIIIVYIGYMVLKELLGK